MTNTLFGMYSLHSAIFDWWGLGVGRGGGEGLEIILQ